MASTAFIAVPVKDTRIDPQPFRLPPFAAPLPLQAHSCQCGRPLDILGTTVQRAQMQVFFGSSRGWVLVWGGSQLAVDTTTICPLSHDGVAQRGTATTEERNDLP